MIRTCLTCRQRAAHTHRERARAREREGEGGREGGRERERERARARARTLVVVDSELSIGTHASVVWVASVGIIDTPAPFRGIIHAPGAAVSRAIFGC